MHSENTGPTSTGPTSGSSRATDHRITALDSMLDKTAALLEAIEPDADRHRRRTPCADYDVAALAEHMALWVQVFAATVNDQPIPFDPSTTRITEGWAASFRGAMERISAGLHEHGIDRPMTMTGDPLPGEFILDMLLCEYLTHGWDLARAVELPVPYDDVEADIALRAAQAIVQPQYRGTGMFGHEVPVTEHADAMSRCVAFLGRDPNWAADRG